LADFSFHGRQPKKIDLITLHRYPETEMLQKVGRLQPSRRLIIPASGSPRTKKKQTPETARIGLGCTEG
jgi:hypothetical protein